MPTEKKNFVTYESSVVKNAEGKFIPCTISAPQNNADGTPKLDADGKRVVSILPSTRTVNLGVYGENPTALFSSFLDLGMPSILQGCESKKPTEKTSFVTLHIVTGKIWDKIPTDSPAKTSVDGWVVKLTREEYLNLLTIAQKIVSQLPGASLAPSIVDEI